MKFSVLMSIYKNERPIYFDKAMQSIWDKQVLKPDEIILVIDGSLTDELELVLSSWINKLDNVLVIVPLKKNLGLGKALNFGLRECSYDFIARMDTDDIALSNRFEKQLKFFENNDVDIIGSYCIEIDELENKRRIRKMPLSHQDIYDNLFANPFIHPSMMFKKSIIEKVGGYDSNLKRRQDYDLWFRCAKENAKFANIGEPLLLYRFTDTTHNKQTFKLMLSQAKIGYIGVKLLNQPYWKALACYIPVFRSLLPNKVQHLIYMILKNFDPRQK